MQKIIYLDKNDPADSPRDGSEQERVEAAVRWINRKVESTVHFGLLQIGYYLLNSFFDGDIQEALSRNPHKQNSFRKLCQRHDLLISSTHLVNAVKLVVQEKQLGTDPAFQKLPVSHKIALLTLPEVADKRSLARRAVRERLSVRALARAVRTQRGDLYATADAWSRRLRRSLTRIARIAEEPKLTGLSLAEAQALDRSIIEARRTLQNALADVRGIRTVQAV